jgi:hypothetical protein
MAPGTPNAAIDPKDATTETTSAPSATAAPGTRPAAAVAIGDMARNAAQRCSGPSSIASRIAWPTFALGMARARRSPLRCRTRSTEFSGPGST